MMNILTEDISQLNEQDAQSIKLLSLIQIKNLVDNCYVARSFNQNSLPTPTGL